MAPELFAAVGARTAYRWKLPEGETAAPRGRLPHLPPVALTCLAELSQQLVAQIAVSSRVLQAFFTKELKAMDIEYEMSSWWVRSFLNTLGLTYKKSGGPLQAVHSDEANHGGEAHPQIECSMASGALEHQLGPLLEHR